MPRIRTIKPEFWTDSKTGTLSEMAKVLFIGMLNHADDYGVLEYDAAALKAKIFPYHSGSATELVNPPLIDELLPKNLASLFSLQKNDAAPLKWYLHVTNFEKHQVVNKPSKPLLEGWKSGDSPDSYGAKFTEDYGSVQVAGPEYSHPEVGSRKYEVGGDYSVLRTSSPQGSPVSAVEQRQPSTEAKGRRLARALDVDDSSEALYASLPESWLAWARAQRPDLSAIDTWHRFVDHWRAQPGQRGVKADWEATWRNWVRKEGPQRSNGAGKQSALEARNSRSDWMPPEDPQPAQPQLTDGEPY